MFTYIDIVWSYWVVKPAITLDGEKYVLSYGQV